MENNSFTLSADIIDKNISSTISISKYIRNCIRYVLKLKCYKLLFAPELDLLIKPSKHRQISVKISNKEIKRISKKYNTTLSDTTAIPLEMEMKGAE